MVRLSSLLNRIDDIKNSFVKAQFSLFSSMEYQPHLHDVHNDYLLAPEHLVFNDMKKSATNT